MKTLRKNDIESMERELQVLQYPERVLGGQGYDPFLEAYFGGTLDEVVVTGSSGHQWMWDMSWCTGNFGMDTDGFDDGSWSWGGNGWDGGTSAAVGFTLAHADMQLANILDNRLAYLNSTSTVMPTTVLFKTPAGNVNMSITAAKNLSTVVRFGGRVFGVAGIAATFDAMYNERISVGEGALDIAMGAMGAVGFAGPVGAAISFAYFGGKWVLEETGNQFW